MDEDAEDKVKCYRNWLGLMKGDLAASIKKNGKSFVRKLNPNRNYISKDGKEISLHGRALLLNRNVGHLMTNPAILMKNGDEKCGKCNDENVCQGLDKVTKCSDEMRAKGSTT